MANVPGACKAQMKQIPQNAQGSYRGYGSVMPITCTTGTNLAANIAPSTQLQQLYVVKAYSGSLVGTSNTTGAVPYQAPQMRTR